VPGGGGRHEGRPAAFLRVENREVARTTSRPGLNRDRSSMILPPFIPSEVEGPVARVAPRLRLRELNKRGGAMIHTHCGKVFCGCHVKVNRLVNRTSRAEVPVDGGSDCKTRSSKKPHEPKKPLARSRKLAILGWRIVCHMGSRGDLLPQGRRVRPAGRASWGNMQSLHHERFGFDPRHGVKWLGRTRSLANADEIAMVARGSKKERGSAVKRARGRWCGKRLGRRRKFACASGPGARRA